MLRRMQPIELHQHESEPAREPIHHGLLFSLSRLACPARRLTCCHDVPNDMHAILHAYLSQVACYQFIAKNQVKSTIQRELHLITQPPTRSALAETCCAHQCAPPAAGVVVRSEEHTSELQSPDHL